MVNTQREIHFINDCNAIVDYKELESAILWYAKSPVVSKKHIYLFGKYPAVSICKKKIHIHRLLMMYWIKCNIPKDYSVHHIDKNKLNASKGNLALVFFRTHQSEHNKGKIISEEQRQKIIERNHKTKGIRRSYKKPITAKQVYDLKNKGYSFNKISQMLNLDWGCVKQRYNDFIHDNPELLQRSDEK